MKKLVSTVLVLCSLLLVSCSNSGRELIDMRSEVVGDHIEVTWDGRAYVPFCVVSKKDMGEQIGYRNGDRDDRISTYKDYPPEEWLVSWIPQDGGAMLLKEKSVTDIPDGLTDEYKIK